MTHRVDAAVIGSGGRKWWALGALSLAVLAVGLDGTVLSVALPTLATALRASESDLQWFTSGYLLVLGAAMLPAGLLGERYGRKSVMMIALALFGVASAGCAYAGSPTAFIAARLVLAAAGAGVIVMALSALTLLFTEAERPRAVGVWSAANFVALPIGPLLGGWLLSHLWWGWVFLLNVPVAVIGLVAVLAWVPQSRAAQRPSVDVVGITTSTVGFVALTYGLIDAGQNGWGSLRAVAAMIAGVVVLVGFFVFERWLGRRPNGQPLVDVALFAAPSYTWGVILVGVAVLAMIGVLFTAPQYFQGVLGTDAMGSGVRLLPLIGGLLLGAIPADRIARATGAKLVVAAGFVLLAAGLLLGALSRVNSGDGYIAGWTALIGAGMGLAMATAASAALSQLTQQQAGMGSAVLQAVNKLAGPLGSAVLGSVLVAAYQARVDLSGLPGPAATAARASVFGAVAVAHQLGAPALLDSARAAFVHGMAHALIVSAGIALAGALLAALFLPARATPTGTMVADESEAAHVP
jgi:DHA2 family multidrug resistance protein-like MFS transporter